MSAPENERQFREIEAIWEVTAVPFQSTETGRPCASEIVSASNSDRPRARRRLPIRLPHAGAVAAALILGLLIGEFRPESRIGAHALEVAKFMTGPTELATARLSDGTVVRLAPGTRLRVGGNGDHREVWLEGKAFFAVTADHPAPFIVRTRSGEALVLGTRFEVDVTSDDLRVLVVEGKVEVGSENGRVQVGAGTISRTKRGFAPEVAVAEDAATLLDWMGLFLAFQHTPLRQVAREIEDRYQIRVEVADSVLARRTVTAWFGDEEAEAVLKVICRIADAHCSIRDGVASIEP
jgi:transmembrane sensor